MFRSKRARAPLCLRVCVCIYFKKQKDGMPPKKMIVSQYIYSRDGFSSRYSRARTDVLSPIAMDDGCEKRNGPTIVYLPVAFTYRCHTSLGYRVWLPLPKYI